MLRTVWSNIYPEQISPGTKILFGEVPRGGAERIQEKIQQRVEKEESGIYEGILSKGETVDGPGAKIQFKSL